MDFVPFFVQVSGAVALVLTAVASLVGAFFGLKTHDKVQEIKIEVDWRFSESQRQLAELMKHILALDPAVAAKVITDAASSAAVVLAVAENAKTISSQMPPPGTRGEG